MMSRLLGVVLGCFEVFLTVQSMLDRVRLKSTDHFDPTLKGSRNQNIKTSPCKLVKNDDADAAAAAAADDDDGDADDDTSHDLHYVPSCS